VHSLEKQANSEHWQETPNESSNAWIQICRPRSFHALHRKWDSESADQTEIGVEIEIESTGAKERVIGTENMVRELLEKRVWAMLYER
jgi:hypothetical protein